MARQRDYRAEYRRRIELGRQRGYSRQTARGLHARTEGGKLPDGSRAAVISVREVQSGRLRTSTLETLHRVNAGLRSFDPYPWLQACRRRGWAVVESRRGGFHTQDDVPSSIIEAMTHRDRQYFYGY